MDRLERLVDLVAALLETTRPLSRAEIRERVPGYPGDDGSFRRMFERDKESIRDMGIPLSVVPLDPGSSETADGYRIVREQYELADPGLLADELAALHLAASAVQLGGADESVEALWKLGGGALDGAPDRSVAIPGSDHLAVLFGAIAARQAVAFGYRGSERRVDPYRLSFRNGRWYLAAHDHSRGGERSFRLDRLETPPATVGAASAFERPPAQETAPPRPWELGDGEEPIEGVVLVDADQADWIVAELGPDAVRDRRPDGAVVVVLRVRNRDAFRSFVLGFLEHAEVLGPADLRDDIVAWLGTLAAG